MSELHLVKPDKKYEESFKRYVLEYKNINDSAHYDKYKKGLENFDEYIKQLEDYSIGLNLPAGGVQVSSFWLVDGEEVVGISRVRHRVVEYSGNIGYDISPSHRNRGYGTLILKLALEEAREIGFREAFINCNVDNPASRRIIEKNGGRLLDTFFYKEKNEIMYRYSIVL